MSQLDVKPDTTKKDEKNPQDEKKSQGKWSDSLFNRIILGVITFWLVFSVIIPLVSAAVLTVSTVKSDEIAQTYGLIPRGGDAYYVTPVADGSYRSLSEEFATPERVYEHGAVLFAQKGEEYELFAKDEDGSVTALTPWEGKDWGVEFSSGDNPVLLANEAYGITLKRTFANTNFGDGGWMSSEAIKNEQLVETVVMWNGDRIGVFKRDGDELTELRKTK